jgi:hypothetical protein
MGYIMAADLDWSGPDDDLAACILGELHLGRGSLLLPQFRHPSDTSPAILAD